MTTGNNSTILITHGAINGATRELFNARSDYITETYTGGNVQCVLYLSIKYAIITNVPDQLLKTLIEISAKHNINYEVYKYYHLVKNKHENEIENFCQEHNIEFILVFGNKYILLTDNISTITLAKLTY